MDLVPQNVHQRIPVILGSPDDVRKCRRCVRSSAPARPQPALPPHTKPLLPPTLTSPSPFISATLSHPPPASPLSPQPHLLTPTPNQVLRRLHIYGNDGRFGRGARTSRLTACLLHTPPRTSTHLHTPPHRHTPLHTGTLLHCLSPTHASPPPRTHPPLHRRARSAPAASHG